MKRNLLLWLAIVAITLPATAQTTAAPAAPVAGSAALTEAAALAADGKVEQAIARLERDRPRLDDRGRSLLGALYLNADRPADALALLRPLADAEGAEAAVLYNAGRAALLGGDLAAGRVYLARSLDKEPTSPAARDLGLLLAREGQVVEAYSLLRPWTLRHADDGDARMVAAGLAITLERPYEAEQLLVGLVDSPAVQLLRARVRVLVGDGAGALRYLQPALANHPPSVDLEVRRVAAEAYLLTGQPHKAMELLAGKARDVPALVLVLARAQRQAGNAAQAMATLRPLAISIPDDPRALGDPRPAAAIAVEYGDLLLAAGKAADAVPLLQKATKLHPQSEPAWQVLARALEAAGRGAEATQAKGKAQELAAARARTLLTLRAQAEAPANAAPPPPGAGAGATAGGPPAAPAMPAYATTALSLANGGRVQQGLDVIRQRLAAAPGDELARTLEVRLLLSLEQHVAALNAAEAALAQAPGNPDFVYLRGAAEMAMHDLAAAERDFRQAIAMRPQHVAAMNDLAVLLMSQGKHDEAKRWLDQVLRLNPRDRTAAANLEQLGKSN